MGWFGFLARMFVEFNSTLKHDFHALKIVKFTACQETHVWRFFREYRFHFSCCGVVIGRNSDVTVLCRIPHGRTNCTKF